jgi:hypothetical protein
LLKSNCPYPISKCFLRCAFFVVVFSIFRLHINSFRTSSERRPLYYNERRSELVRNEKMFTFVLG